MPDENQVLEPVNSFFGSMGERTVDKIANALGMVFPYAGLERLAVDTYIDSIKAGDFTPEEKYMLISGAKKHLKQIKNQQSIAQIAQNTAAEGTDFSVNSEVDDEWLDRFMDAAKFVSDEDAQHIWGSVLAGEFERPGSTPPNVIRILSELRAQYAQAFSTLCSLKVGIIPFDSHGNVVRIIDSVIVTDIKSTFLSQYNINYSTITEMEQLGLIVFEDTGLVYHDFAQHCPNIHIYYNGNCFTLTKQPSMGLPIGQVRLTDAGQCIAKYVEKKIIPGYLEEVKQYMTKKGCTLSPEPVVKIEEWQSGTKTGYRISNIENLT